MDPAWQAFWEEFHCLRLAKYVVPPSLEAERYSLTTLPTRCGKLGLLSRYVIAPAAWGTAKREDDKVVNKVFQQLLETQETDGEDPFLINNTRCEKTYGNQRRGTARMKDDERKCIVDA